MKNKFFKMMAVVAIFTTVSCESWLDVNDSPNSVVSEKVPPKLLLAAAQAQTYKAISGDTENSSVDISTSNMNQLGNIWMGTWAGNSNNTTGANANEYGVILNATFYNNIWDYTYMNIANLHNIATYNSNDWDNHKAIAMILKSYYMQYIVDLYGDCPYSEAFLGTGNAYPKYDDDKAIYRALVDQIDAAIAMIDPNDNPVLDEDIMFKGDMTQWKKFGYTVKLRLLMRQSGLTDADTQNYIDDELDQMEADGATFLTTDATLNPGYDNSVQDHQNPFYASYGYNIAGSATTLRSYVTATKFAADALNGAVTGVVDPRRNRLFTLSGGQVVGIVQGEDAASAPDNPSFIGPAIVPTNTVVGSALDSYVITLSETKFLLAEAAYRFPAHAALFPDGAQTYFEAGITASFDRLGAGSSAGYIGAIDSVAGYGWTGSSDKVQAIMTQKWIALMHVNGIESWIDRVRTGFPSVPLPLTNTTGLPKRLMYPTSEYTSNSANVPAQTAANCFATGPFWKS
ncbi:MULTISPECIES: SusD/RagB family nutrient-binding outer membrane lipoprotein [Flavobacterium]|nr:SusD/RagB family nutrient-binding outer membrane lipoprotein [Flavobacterium sp. N1846]